MNFLFGIAFGVELVALAAGVVLLVWSYRTEKCCGRGLARVFGYIITIAAGLVILCTTFHGYKSYKNYKGHKSGYCNCHHGGNQGQLVKKIHK